MTPYAWLMLGSFLGPFFLSFDKKVAFYKLWPAVFLGILVNGIFFVIWDSWFTINGIWSFNPQHVWDIRLMSLPLEEISFFIVVPYASIFIYACCKAYFSDQFFSKLVSFLNLSVLAILAFLLIRYSHCTYTFFNCLFAFVLLLLHQFWLKKNYMGYFWMAYFIHLIPFLIVNGVLTATPVVLYNPNEITGFRIYTIPIEDTVYALTCLLLPITVMEYYLEKRKMKMMIKSNL
ncbi:MAG TPA: lycopene cyclase domain-containing protein [Chitinophagaceae bacterium]|nr:lycopene cyclase domain-containing protein [Chitinophagaceae bacterium]